MIRANLNMRFYSIRSPRALSIPFICRLFSSFPVAAQLDALEGQGVEALLDKMRDNASRSLRFGYRSSFLHILPQGESGTFCAGGMLGF